MEKLSHLERSDVVWDNLLPHFIRFESTFINKLKYLVFFTKQICYILKVLLGTDQANFSYQICFMLSSRSRMWGKQWYYWNIERYKTNSVLAVPKWIVFHSFCFMCCGARNDDVFNPCNANAPFLYSPKNVSNAELFSYLQKV